MQERSIFRIAFTVSSLVLLCLPALSRGQEAKLPEWSYTGKEGPKEWGKLGRAYAECAEGKTESPIDIEHAAPANLPALALDYKAVPLAIVDNGHTVEVVYPGGSTLKIGDHTYTLEQFHFHHPAEEAVRGKLTDMDVHLVHKSADGKLLVIAVRFAMDRGNPNAVMAMLWPHMPKTAGATEKVPDIVNPGGFLPADRGYWTYVGSLTAPPCTEGVRWIIYENALSLSLDQLRTFMMLYRMNSRPLQDPHGRRIEGNE